MQDKKKRISLDKYKEKLEFSATPKTVGKGEEIDRYKLVFVVQKHYASHLHYDFRLEVDGVLKSWAIPKGPSLNPKDKHLAVMVEDHPFEYRNFEGIIPEGNYGAGRVIIWDEGTYNVLGAENKKQSIKKIKEDLDKGHITFILHGKKLKGEFAMIRLKKAKENDWLIIKKSDEFTCTEDILF